MAKRKNKSARRGMGGAKLGKRCPKPGVMVRTRAGLIGITTGQCAARRIKVALMGAGERTYTRGELKKVPKGQMARIAKELQRPKAAPVPVPVVKFEPRPRNLQERLRQYRASRPATLPTPATAQDRFFDGY